MERPKRPKPREHWPSDDPREAVEYFTPDDVTEYADTMDEWLREEVKGFVWDAKILAAALTGGIEPKPEWLADFLKRSHALIAEIEGEKG